MSLTPEALVSFLNRKISRGATRPGRCNPGAPAGAGERQFSGGSLPSFPLTLFLTQCVDRTCSVGSMESKGLEKEECNPECNWRCGWGCKLITSSPLQSVAALFV